MKEQVHSRETAAFRTVEERPFRAALRR